MYVLRGLFIPFCKQLQKKFVGAKAGGFPLSEAQETKKLSPFARVWGLPLYDEEVELPLSGIKAIDKFFAAFSISAS